MVGDYVLYIIKLQNGSEKAENLKAWQPWWKLTDQSVALLAVWKNLKLVVIFGTNSLNLNSSLPITIKN